MLQALQLDPIQTIVMQTASTGLASHTSQQYEVSLVVPGAEQQDVPLTLSNTSVIATELGRSGFQALIGRDVLGDCMLVYNGSHGNSASPSDRTAAGVPNAVAALVGFS